MAANVESMFFVRETPWHGLGTRVMEAPTSKEALRLAGLDWKVLQEPILTTRNEIIPGFKANIRDKDHRVLGVVTDRYKIIQNDEAFAFTDALLGAGYATRRQEASRTAGVYGSLPTCRESISSWASISARICSSATLTMAPALSRYA